MMQWNIVKSVLLLNQPNIGRVYEHERDKSV